MVVAVIAILLALTIPAVTSISASRDIVKAVDTTQGIASTARQQAITKGTMVALLLSPASAASISSPQEFILLQASVNSSGPVTWAATTSWMRLPVDIQATPLTRNGVSSFYTVPTSGASQIPSLPTTVANQSVASFSYIVFNSDGSVLAPTTGPAINLQKITQSTPAYMVLIQEASGRTNVSSLQ